MPYLDDWKRAKTAFETATKKKKPSEKFLGLFSKSSGLEAALKTLDAAFAQKRPKEVAKAKADYKKTMEAYTTTMVKGAKAEAGDVNYQKELGILNGVLNDILTRATGAALALQKDPKALMTVAEAIGPEALAALNKSKILTNADLKVWMTSTDSQGVMVGGIMNADPDSIRECGKAKNLFAQIKTAFDAFKAVLPKELERGKALALAFRLLETAQEKMGPMDGIQQCMGMWADAQEQAVREFSTKVVAGKKVLDRELAKADHEAWQQKSAAWKAVLKLEPFFQSETQFHSDFHHELGKR